ncbi:MAG: AraC family transcriptional regulator [Capsulimonadaceae bacterium]|nr:AraC family transcriptional regulator [Capsulimonadaceae bacterium]
MTGQVEVRLSRHTYKIQSGFPVQVHWHYDQTCNRIHDHEFMEIALVVEGAGVHYSACGKQRISRGDVLVVQPQAWHTYMDSEGLVILNCMFGYELFQRDIPVLARDPAVQHMIEVQPGYEQERGILPLHLPEEKFVSCIALVNEIEELLTRDIPCAEAECLAYLMHFIVTIARGLGQDNSDAHNRVRALPRPVFDCLCLLDGAPFEPWTIEDLADRLHYNRHYIMRVFKQAVGVSIGDYLTRQRAERAAKLLRNSDRGVADIAAEVGWPDQTYFARRFKAYHGMTASEYRVRHSGRTPNERAAELAGRL